MTWSLRAEPAPRQPRTECEERPPASSHPHPKEHPTGEASETRSGLVTYHGRMNLSFPERIRVDAIIQAAMDMEAAPLLHALTPIGDDETPQALLAGTHKTQRYALGELDGKTVLVVTSGIGLANAASATARALTLVDAPIVIAAGTTGGLARDINVGDIAAGTTAIYGQADATAFGYAMGQVPQMPVDYTTSDAAVARLAELPALITHTCANASPTPSAPTWKPAPWPKSAGPPASTGSACAPSPTCADPAPTKPSTWTGSAPPATAPKPCAPT